jgi:hypothetical protein
VSKTKWHRWFGLPQYDKYSQLAGYHLLFQILMADHHTTFKKTMFIISRVLWSKIEKWRQSESIKHEIPEICRTSGILTDYTEMELNDKEHAV